LFPPIASNVPESSYTTFYLSFYQLIDSHGF
jgi:hypothetical protein